MAMTKIDYKRLARFLADSYAWFPNARMHVGFCYEMGKELKAHNARFDMMKWIDACMPSYVPGTTHEKCYEEVKRTWLRHNLDHAELAAKIVKSKREES